MFYNNVKTILLLGAMTALILGIGSFFGRQGVTIAVIIAIAMNFYSYFFSAKLALATMKAREVAPDHPLYKLVERLCQRANMPMPRVYVSPTQAPNAFATGRNPQNAAVCATEGLLQMLNENEVAGVMAHELAHVRHRDILIQSVAITIATAISYLGYIAMMGGGSRDREGGGHPLAGILALIVGPLAASLIQAAISRSREFNADTGGAEICGDPMYLATALEKIHHGARRIPMDVNPAFNSMFIAEPFNAIKSLSNLFATHPPLEKRLMNLIGQPTTGRVRYN